MKKIVFFNSAMAMGGPARVASIWGNYFAKNGYEVEVVSNINAPLFYDFDDRIKCSILGIDEFRQKNKIKTLYKIWLFLKNRRNEILIFNKALYINYLFLLKCLKLINKSLKLVYFEHGGSNDFRYVYSNLKISLINKTFDSIIALHDDYDFFDNSIKKSSRSLILDKIFSNSWYKIKNKISYIQNPVSFKVDNSPNYESKLVVAVGRLDYIKGFDLLIDAWNIVNKKFCDWTLRIVGDGDERASLEKQIKHYGLESKICIAGISNDVKSELLNASILVMPSREEGMPMVLLEAMECGLPIVAFDSAGAKFLVQNGHNGMICKVGDVESLAYHICCFIDNENLRKEYGSNSKKCAQKFYIENLICKWKAILDE